LHGYSPFGGGEKERRAMNSAIIVMTLLGCAQGETQCELIATLDRPFESRAQCEAAADAELMKSGNSGYPTVIAQCEEKQVAAIPDLPGPGLAAPDAMAPGEPKVIASEFDRPGLVARAVSGTKRFLGGVRRAVGSVFEPFRRKPETDPIILGRFGPEDS